MQSMVVAWESGAFTEEEIVSAFKCSHLDFRQALRAAHLAMPDVVPRSMWEEIRAEYMAGMLASYNNAKWVSEQYGISLPSAYRYQKDKPIAKNLSEQIQDMLAQGIPQKEIAAELNITQATVSNNNPHRKKKKRGKGLSDTDWKLLKAQMTALSISELARLYKVSRPYIYARLKREEESC